MIQYIPHLNLVLAGKALSRVMVRSDWMYSCEKRASGWSPPCLILCATCVSVILPNEIQADLKKLVEIDGARLILVYGPHALFESLTAGRFTKSTQHVLP